MPRAAEPTVQCAFRLPASLVEQVDAYAAKMGEDQPGIQYSRADVVRLALTRLVDEAAGGRRARKAGAR